jgi:hypothetical protein
MDDSNSLLQLQEGEICEVFIRGSWKEVSWCMERQCFLRSSNGDITICPTEEIEEWRPASAKF